MNKEEIVDKIIEILAESIAGKYQIVDGKLQPLLESEPKLRHGDYGYAGKPSKNNMYFIDGRPVRPFGISNDGGQEMIDAPYHQFKAVGNIFDDLKAMSEDVKEFKIKQDSFVDAVHVYFQDEGCLVIKDLGDNDKVYISPKNVELFHRKLGAMIATAKRQCELIKDDEE